MTHNAVELPVDLAWSIADRAGAGSFPWVLAITPPQRPPTAAEAGPIDPAVADWLRVVCHPQQWFELRYVRTGTTRSDLLRGVVARRDGRTVVALRNAQLLTLTVIRVEDADSLAPILTVGLDRRPAARFTEFAIPARIGARADEQLRSVARRLHTILIGSLLVCGVAGALHVGVLGAIGTNVFIYPPVLLTALVLLVALHRGRTTMVWQTSNRNQDGKLCAVVTQTQLVMKK